MRIGSRQFDFASRTHVMGIINATPDSFSDGGRFDSLTSALNACLQMVEDGVDIIDIGGMSTRPGSKPIPREEEAERVLPIIKALRKESDVPISIDTFRASVAEKALDVGADMVNDISAMSFDAGMITLVSERACPVVLMHTADVPEHMQKTYHYDDVVGEIRTYLNNRITSAVAAGVERTSIIIDPGIGFGKSVSHNLSLIRSIDAFATLGCPVLMGPSRKGFIGQILDLPVTDRLEGTLGAVAACALNGAGIVRVHDVKETVRVCRICDAISGRSHSAE